MSTRSKTERISATIPSSTKEAIIALAERMGISDSEAINHLLKIGLTIEAIAFAGGEIIALYPNNQRVTLADRTGNYIQREFK